MKCPYCDKEMRPGFIYGDRYKLKWMPKDKKLVLGIWAHNAVNLGDSHYIGRTRVFANYCEDCNKMIVDVNES